jgi:hypothetical protein
VDPETAGLSFGAVMDESWRLEVAPELETYFIGGRSVSAWHEFLTTDHYTGEPSGHLEVPSSRYGRNGNETAWWAIAAHAAYSYATGDDNEPGQSMDYFMSLAVNDEPSVYGLVSEFRWVVPAELDGKLDWDQAISSHI